MSRPATFATPHWRPTATEPRFRRLALCSFVAYLSVVGMPAAHADEASFNNAVNLYLSGYSECEKSNDLRSTDIASARKHFDQYQKTLDQAAAIDPTILKSRQRDMASKIAFCERVHNNLRMAEAAPILEQGFTHCEAARTAMEAEDFTTASQAFDAYTAKRDEALAITENIMGVYNLASQVRACNRLEEKVEEARSAKESEQKALAALTTQWQRYGQACQKALGFTRQSNFSIDGVEQANKLLAEAQHARKQAFANAAGNAALKSPSNKEAAAAIKQTMEAGGRCEAEATTLIRNMQGQKQLAESSLTTATTSLQSATKTCTQAQKLLKQSARNLAQAKKLESQARASLETGSAANLSALAKRHADWAESKAWVGADQQARQCLQTLQTTISKTVVPPPVAPVKKPEATKPEAAKPAAPAPTKPTPVATPAAQPAAAAAQLATPAAATAPATSPDAPKTDTATRSSAADQPATIRTSVLPVAPGLAAPRPAIQTKAMDTKAEAQENAPAKPKLRKSWTDLAD
ncbi:Hypothetical protein HDN1F_29170 [gamma proteobacterium HdN1]|nr:Hypothetical protein HDN1F_29170 [gamma proteobacterium HdN1]